jgi:hypothetical protein
VARCAAYIVAYTGARIDMLNLGRSGQTSPELLHALRNDPAMFTEESGRLRDETSRVHSGGSRGALYSIGRHTSAVGRPIPRVVLVRVGSSAPRWIRSRTARFGEGLRHEVAIQETADNPLMVAYILWVASIGTFQGVVPIPAAIVTMTLGLFTFFAPWIDPGTNSSSVAEPIPMAVSALARCNYHIIPVGGFAPSVVSAGA